MNKREQSIYNIMCAALALFRENGFRDTNVRQIAERADISLGMVNHYFGSKEGLYMAVLEAVYARLSQCEAASGLEALEEEAAIAALVEAYFRFLSENDSYVRMVMWENLHRGRFMDAKNLHQVRDPMRRAMGQLIARGKASGRFRADADEEQALLSLFALTFNYFSNRHTLSRVMHKDLMDEGEKRRRIAAITAMILADLKEDAG